MELRHLRYFYEVANEMNFSKAAEKLHISQPPLSKQIKDLEEEVGVTLFIRRPHYMALTPEGEALKQYAAQILVLTDKAYSMLKEMKSGLHGIINIGFVEGHTMTKICQWSAEFSKENPAVQFSMWSGNSDDIATRLKNGLCDIAVVSDADNIEGLKAFELYKESWSALIPISHPLSGYTGYEKVADMTKDIQMGELTVDAEELLNYDLIVPSRSGRMDLIASWSKDGSKKPQVKFKYTTMPSAYELAKQGAGIAIYPGEPFDLFRNPILSGIVVKRIVNPSTEASYNMLYPGTRIVPHVVHEFITYVKMRSKA